MNVLLVYYAKCRVQLIIDIEQSFQYWETFLKTYMSYGYLADFMINIQN